MKLPLLFLTVFALFFTYIGISSSSFIAADPNQVRPFGSRWILRQNASTTTSPGNGTIEFAMINAKLSNYRFGTLCNMPTDSQKSATLAANLCRMLNAEYNSGVLTAASTSTASTGTDNKNATFDTIDCGSDPTMLQSRLEDCNMTIGSGWWDSGANPQCSGSAPVLTCSTITEEISHCDSAKEIYSLYGYSIIRRDAFGNLTFEGRGAVSSCSDGKVLAQSPTTSSSFPIAYISNSSSSINSFHANFMYESLVSNTPMKQFASISSSITYRSLPTTNSTTFVLPCVPNVEPIAHSLSGCVAAGTSFESTSLPSMSMNFEPGWLTSGQWQLRLNPSSQVVEMKLKNQTRWSCACGRGFSLATARGLCNIYAKMVADANPSAATSAPVSGGGDSAGEGGGSNGTSNKYDPFYYWASYKYSSSVSSVPATHELSPDNYPAIATIECPETAQTIRDCVILPVLTTTDGTKLASPICTNTMSIALQCNVSSSFPTSAPTSVYSLSDRNYYFGGEFSNRSAYVWPSVTEPGNPGLPVIVVAFISCISVAFFVAGICSLTNTIREKWREYTVKKQIKSAMKTDKNAKFADLNNTPAAAAAGNQQQQQTTVLVQPDPSMMLKTVSYNDSDDNNGSYGKMKESDSPNYPAEDLQQHLLHVNPLSPSNNNTIAMQPTNNNDNGNIYDNSSFVPVPVVATSASSANQLQQIEMATMSPSSPTTSKQQNDEAMITDNSL